MHVPAKDDGAEAEAVFGHGEELGFGHELTAQDTVNVDAGDLDFGVALEFVFEGFEIYHVGGLGGKCSGI